MIKSQNLLENPLLFPTEITNFPLEPNSRKAEILYIIQCDVGASKNAEQAFSTKRLSSHCIIYKISAFRLFSSTNQYLFKIFYSAFEYLLILFCVDILRDIVSDTFGMCHLTKDTTIWNPIPICVCIYWSPFLSGSSFLRNVAINTLSEATSFCEQLPQICCVI